MPAQEPRSLGALSPKDDHQPSDDDSTIQLALIDPDTKKLASMVSQGKKYRLNISWDGELYIGAIRLRLSNSDMIIRDLALGMYSVAPPFFSLLQASFRTTSNVASAAKCLKNETEAMCKFIPPEEVNKALEGFSNLKHRQDNVGRKKISLSLFRIPELSLGESYNLEVLWANVVAPARDSFGSTIVQDPRSDPQLERPLALPYAIAGAVDVGFDLPSTSTISPNRNNPSATSSLDPSATASPNSNNQSNDSKGLSDGAKAGIAVGAVLGVLLLLALIFLCLRRRKSKRKTAGGYYGDAPGSSNDLREKEARVGIAAVPASESPSSDGHHAHNGDAAMLERGNSGRVVDGASLERGDVGGHAAPVGGVGAAGVVRKPIGSRGVSDEKPVGREGAISSQSQMLSDEERARWEEEERRLDEDIAEAERRRLA